MARYLATVRPELEPEADLELHKWAKSEGRSKRRHCAILLQRLAQLRQRGPGALTQMDSGAILRELDLLR
jgi:hypothetical protein